MKVLVKHQSKLNPRTGLVNLVPASREIREVIKQYPDGRVCDHVGEIWGVKPCAESCADFETTGKLS